MPSSYTAVEKRPRTWPALTAVLRRPLPLLRDGQKRAKILISMRAALATYSLLNSRNDMVWQQQQLSPSRRKQPLSLARALTRSYSHPCHASGMTCSCRVSFLMREFYANMLFTGDDVASTLQTSTYTHCSLMAGCIGCIRFRLSTHRPD